MPDCLKVEDKFSTVPDALNLANNNVLCKYSTTPEILIPSSHICKVKTEVKDEKDLVPDSTRDASVDNNETETDQIQLDTGQSDCNSDDSQDSLEVLKCDSTLPYSDEDSKINILWQSASDAMSAAQTPLGVDTQANNDQSEEDNASDLLLTCPMCLHHETM